MIKMKDSKLVYQSPVVDLIQLEKEFCFTASPGPEDLGNQNDEIGW